MRPPKIAVIGHVEHITIGRVPAVPREGDIVHLADPAILPGGGGGLAFAQLVRSDAELVLFTALGGDDAARFVETELAKTGARIHAARRAGAHTRDVVMITPRGERTIIVAGEPLHPRRDDALPWDELAGCDAAYFTAQDPEVLREARHARVLIATARRRDAIIRSGVRCDVIIGSAGDPREASTLADYPVPPRALVMTEGAAGGRVETAGGAWRFRAPELDVIAGGAYGAGDSFAGALAYFVAIGSGVLEAAERAAAYGAAVLRGINPLDHQQTVTR